ncbi:conserved hypothetical protein [Caulobacter segnis ATCC 21756]|uniref:Uncharacterized protein n=2 Tax=Caulobacter segnis TaxID=88688 RepID=D5VPB8_CAUST|nr:conserved hypothetical protein [Caulobacter segnis ATCC 21756]
MAMDEFIRRKNIELFRAKLKREHDPELRETLEELLKEYEALPLGGGDNPPIAA